MLVLETFIVIGLTGLFILMILKTVMAVVSLFEEFGCIAGVCFLIVVVWLVVWVLSL